MISHSILKSSEKTEKSIIKRKYKKGNKGKNDRMVVLACEDCKERNYTTTKNKKNIKERLELSKYCPKCKKHTAHKETK